MDYYSITMNNITILDCVEDYCYRGNRPIISDGKIEGLLMKAIMILIVIFIKNI